MAKKLPIPDDPREWPDYEYRPFPRWVGRDEFGQDLIAQSEEEATELEKRKVYPIFMGLDSQGRRVEAGNAEELKLRKSWVTRPADQLAEEGAPAEKKPKKAAA